MSRTIAATDGSCIGNPGPGGWAWVTQDGREGFAGAKHSTNNRMELRAVLELLRAVDAQESLLIQCDSAYVIGIFTEWLPRWREQVRAGKRKQIRNVDIIDQIEEALKGREVTFEKVPAHAGHALNTKADALANGAALRAKERLAREKGK